MAAFATILSIATYAGLAYTIPPPQCFANFNWNDCGKPPQPVIYYWKTGSRCEVGIWRGCLPNINMFKDEYECVSTCIFTVRAADAKWHIIHDSDEDITANMTDYEYGSDFGNSTSEYDNSTSTDEITTAGGDATGAITGNDKITKPDGGETGGTDAAVETTPSMTPGGEDPESVSEATPEQPVESTTVELTPKAQNQIDQTNPPETSEPGNPEKETEEPVKQTEQPEDP